MSIAGWLRPLFAEVERRRKIWRESQRAHREGRCLTRSEAARKASLVRWGKHASR